MHANFVSSNLHYLLQPSSESPSLSNVMARVETEVGNRKLSVAETLKQATAALETHRAWMKRRVSTSIAPLDQDTGSGEETAIVDVGDAGEGYPKAVSVGWALGSGKELKQQGDNEPAGSPTARGIAVEPAPPPSVRTWQQGGVLTSLTPLAEEQEAANHHAYENGSSSTNSPLTQANHDLLESPNTPFPDLGQGSPDSGTPVDNFGTATSNKLHFTFPTSSQTKQPNFKIKKRQRMGKSTVVPVGESLKEVNEEQSEVHPSDDILLLNRTKSPDVFIGESFQSKLSPIPPASTLVAWSSLTSLDNYIESLEASNKEQKISHPKSAKLTSSTPLGSTAKDTEEGNHSTKSDGLILKALSSSQQHPDLVQSSAIHHTDTATHSTPSPAKAQEDSFADHSIPSPPKNESGESFESSSNAEQFEVLKAASSAKLIPVSQAPRTQRSSFSLHKQTKLMAAEADMKIYEGQLKSSSNLQTEDQLTSYRDEYSLRNSSLTDIPDSVLQTVLPKQGERVRKSGLAVLTTDIDRNDDEGATLVLNGQQSPLVEETDKNQQLSPTNSQPTTCMSQTSLKGLQISVAPLEKQSDKPLNKASLISRSKSFPANTARINLMKDSDTSLKNDELHVQQVGSRSGAGGLYPSHSTPKFKSHALESLNLPPLKMMIDESEIVKSLPPLKIRSPLTPHLKAFTSLSRKREFSPPPYTIHRLAGGKALSPPCPAYGTEQPQEKDVLRVISSNRGSLSPDDIDSLLAVGSTTSSVSRKTSSKVATCTVGGGSPHDPTNDLKLLPVSASLPEKGFSEEGGGRMIKSKNSTSILGRQSSHTFVTARGHVWDKTKIEDVETTDSFPLHTTQLVLSGGGKVIGHDQGDGIRASESEDTAWSSRGLPIDNVGVSSSSHIQQQATPPEPGPLHMAAKSGNLRRLQSLIKQGHDVDMPEHEGRTPLMYCVHSRGVHLSCADALIQEGANLNKQSSDGSTVMHLAASVGALSLIELLLLNGANPDIRDFEGRLPLHWATIQHSPKTITLLLQHSNFDLNVTDDAGMTPLMWAAYHNNVTITTFLLHEGADHEEKDIDGYTAMHWAIHRTGTECLRLLLKPDMTYFKDHQGRTVIHLAAKEGAMAACELIIKMRPDAIFDTDKMGHTPLHYAAACSRVDVCALLLDLGADASQRDSEGLSPLDYARRKKLDYVVALLTCHGTALADFARASRSTSVSSFLNRTVSFSQLNVDNIKEEGDKEERSRSPNTSNSDNTSLSTALSSHLISNLSKSLTSINMVSASPHSKLLEEDSQLSMSSSHLYQPTDDDSVSLPEYRKQRASNDDSKMETAKGGYLGRFINDRRDPIKHYYFWLKRSEGSICWSRLRENATNHNSQWAVVLEVHEGPSQAVKKNPSYSPGDLHKYVFWVLTGGGVLDLFAYNEDAYGMWLNNISNVANSNMKRGIENLNLKNQSRTTSRPASSHSVKYSRATVAPVDSLANEGNSSTTRSIVNSGLSTGTGEANLIRSVAGAKVDTAWASGSTTHDRKENQSIDGSKLSLFNRSFSAPEHQLPLTSTPLSLSHTSQQQMHQMATGVVHVSPMEQTARSGLHTHVQHTTTDSDII